MPTKSETSGALKLTPAEHIDVEALVALRIEAMRESLERIGRFDPVRARERFLSGFVPENTRHIIIAGERVGFAVVKEQSGELLLDHLYVKPSFQNQGGWSCSTRSSLHRSKCTVVSSSCRRPS